MDGFDKLFDLNGDGKLDGVEKGMQLIFFSELFDEKNDKDESESDD